MDAGALSRKVFVLVAVLLVSGARSAAAWQAVPGVPAVVPPEAPPPPTPPPDPVGPRAPDVEVPGKHVIVGPPLVRAPAPVPVRPRLVAPPPVIVHQPPPPPPEASAGEVGRGAGQIAVGTVGMALMGAAAVGAGEGAGAGAAVVFLLAGPLTGGLIVCGIGRTSAYYEGGWGCGSTLAGAYIGALTAIPLALIIADNCQPDPAYAGYEGRAFECLGPALAGFAIGYTLGTALGATIGWHLGKKPRAAPDGRVPAAPAPAVPTLGQEWPELHRRPPGPAPRAARLSLPLLAFSF